MAAGLAGSGLGDGLCWSGLGGWALLERPWPEWAWPERPWPERAWPERPSPMQAWLRRASARRLGCRGRPSGCWLWPAATALGAGLAGAGLAGAGLAAGLAGAGLAAGAAGLGAGLRRGLRLLRGAPLRRGGRPCRSRGGDICPSRASADEPELVLHQRQTAASGMFRNELHDSQRQRLPSSP